MFRDIRAHFGIKKKCFLDELLQDMELLSGGAGRSGSEVWTSKNGLFVIKSITYEEGKLLRTILSRYYAHVKLYPHTLLVRIYGLYRVTPPNGPEVRLIVMNNIFYTKKHLHLKFDLKGSKVGREVLGEGGTLKDVNFDRKMGKIYLSTQKKEVMKQLERDVNFLTQQDIMDESLLLGYHNSGLDEKSVPIRKRGKQESEQISEHIIVFEGMIDGPLVLTQSGLLGSVFQDGLIAMEDKDLGHPRKCEGGIELYFIGIVDILQLYNFKKQFESKLKSMQHKASDVSSISTAEYAERFLNYCDRIIE